MINYKSPFDAVRKELEDKRYEEECRRKYRAIADEILKKHGLR